MLNRDEFQKILWEYYDRNKRDLPWRLPEADGTFDPYKILVSEMMLQQTQVLRVIPKYQRFLAVFPDIQTLAEAPLAEVLREWQGLGYNRRAQYLRDAAKKLVSRAKPWTREDLLAGKGIGPNTAAAVSVYSYNRSEIFVETNIRSVYLHHFFNDGANIADKEILPLLDQTIDRQNPREFYWALMDYGTYIKKTFGNPNKASRHYIRQSRFEGSARQVRGEVLRQLVLRSRTADELKNLISDERLERMLQVLEKEGLIRKKASEYHL